MWLLLQWLKLTRWLLLLELLMLLLPSWRLLLLKHVWRAFRADRAFPAPAPCSPGSVLSLLLLLLAFLLLLGRLLLLLVFWLLPGECRASVASDSVNNHRAGGP